MEADEIASVALRYVDEITAYAHRLAGSPADAEDLVQATYEQALRRANTLRDPARVRPWLFRIARNLHVDRVRARAARPELRVVPSRDQEASHPVVVSPETVERAQASELTAALDSLPIDQRETVLLSDLWGFRYGEIAEITDVPIGTVRSRIARGRDALARRLTRDHSGDNTSREEGS